MNKLAVVVLACLTGILLAAAAPAQPANADLAMKIANARKQNAVLMHQYTWSSRTELKKDEKTRDIRLESVAFGPDGKVQRTLVNDQGSPLPRGFLRRAIAEKEKKETEKYLGGLRALLDQYTLPSAGKILDFTSSAKIDGIQSPDGRALLKLAGSSVVSPGDSLILEVDPASAKTQKMQVTTTFEDSQVTVSATFKTNRDGLTHLEFAEIEIPDKNLSVQVHYYDFQRND